MHSTFPQLGHSYPQMGCSDGQMGRYYPQLGATVYDESMGRHQDYMNQTGQGGQMGGFGGIDIGQALSEGLTKVFGNALPQELKNAILNSAQGQQAVQVLANTAGTLTKEQAAAQAASYWTQKQQELTSQFNQLLNYTTSNYKKILTYVGLGVGALVVAYFAWPVVKGMMKGGSTAMAVAGNPRRRRKSRRGRKSRRRARR